MKKTTRQDAPKHFSACFMSNAKWRKAFEAIGGESASLFACRWKFVDWPEPVPGHVPDPAQLGTSYVGDCGAASSPFEFSSIEWVEFPAIVPHQRYPDGPLQPLHQDLGALRERLEAAGQFELEATPNGLRLVAYRK